MSHARLRCANTAEAVNNNAILTNLPTRPVFSLTMNEATKAAFFLALSTPLDPYNTCPDSAGDFVKNQLRTISLYDLLAIHTAEGRKNYLRALFTPTGEKGTNDNDQLIDTILCNIIDHARNVDINMNAEFPEALKSEYLVYLHSAKITT